MRYPRFQFVGLGQVSSDMIGTLETHLVKAGKLGIEVIFAYGNGTAYIELNNLCEWRSEE